MEKQKEFNKFKEFIGLFDKSISTNDFHEMYGLFPFIDRFEESFLSAYQKRKEDGTFYTHRTISDFIVTETLLCLITKKLKECNKISRNIENVDEILKFDQDLKQKITKILLTITICDPACGSGIFLLSTAQIIYNIILKLNSHLSCSQIKNQLINNLYGFDINEFAIKLCFLKLLKWFTDGDKEILKDFVSPLKSNFRIQNSIIDSKIPKFDVIIGNPPYGNILNQKEKELLKKDKIFYKDIYCTFLLKALSWSNEIIGFLVPKSFLLRQSYIKFRNIMLSKANICKIFDIGSKLFKRATNEVQVLIYENKVNEFDAELTIYDYPKTKIISYQKQTVDSLRICFNLNCPLCVKSKKFYVYTSKKNCPYCKSNTIELNRIRIKPNQEIYQLIEKIEKIGDLNYLSSVNFPKMIRGEEELGLEIVKSKLRNDLSGSCFFISAKNDFNYYSFKKNRSFKIEELDSTILKGNDFKYYKEPKLLIKHNNIIPEAIFTKENVCFTSSIYSLLHDDIGELKYLCAILNSILIQFYCIYAINNQKDTTINLNQYMIRHLPIVKIEKKIKNKIVEKIDLIDSILQDNDKTDLNNYYSILKEIDNIVFDIYYVTENEANLIISNTKNQIKHFATIYKN
ncbi:MAG: class I SAM-dependent DNA methyltransferase [Candidatus Heimdallarchaeota archaeon]